MFPGTYVPRYRCSPNLCSPVPMFPGTYVPRFTAHLLDVVIGIGIQSEHFEEKNNSGLYSVGAYTCMRVCDGAHVYVCVCRCACVRACVCVSSYMYVGLRICIGPFIRTYVRTTYVGKRVHACVRGARAHACEYVRARV